MYIEQGGLSQRDNSNLYVISHGMEDRCCSYFERVELKNGLHFSVSKLTAIGWDELLQPERHFKQQWAGYPEYVFPLINDCVVIFKF